VSKSENNKGNNADADLRAYAPLGAYNRTGKARDSFTALISEVTKQEYEHLLSSGYNEKDLEQLGARVKKRPGSKSKTGAERKGSKRTKKDDTEDFMSQVHSSRFIPKP